MSDCNYCPVEQDCHYPFKPCDCVHQRKFWDKERRAEYDKKKGIQPTSNSKEINQNKNVSIRA